MFFLNNFFHFHFVLIFLFFFIFYFHLVGNVSELVFDQTRSFEIHLLFCDDFDSALYTVFQDPIC